MVVLGKRDIRLPFGRYEIRLVIAVQQIQLFLRAAVASYTVKDIDEVLLALPIDFGKFQRHGWVFPKHICFEEKRTWIILTHHLPLTILYHRRQLVKVADKKNL